MTITAYSYHTDTSYDRLSMKPHVMDWSGQPSVFKSYPGRQTILLLQDGNFGQKTLSEVLEQLPMPDHENSLDFLTLSRILIMSHTVTAKARYGGSDFFYRSVASAGALYPFELYVAVQNFPDLATGVYHYDVAIGALTLLRRGNAFEEIKGAIQNQRHEDACAAFFLSSIYFRSSWKYRSRAYRYHLLDTGHLVENLTLALKSEGVPHELTYDFHDHEINQLLGLDTNREICLAVVFAFGNTSLTAADLESLDDVAPDLALCSRVSAREVDYPLIRRIHEASCQIIDGPREAPGMLDTLGIEVQRWFSLPAMEESPESMSNSKAVFARRSMRNFVRRELSWDHFSYLIRILCSGNSDGADRADASCGSVQVGLLTGNVQGLKPGFYLLNLSKGSIGLVAEGYLVDRMTQVCLEQQWLANCAIHFLFMSNLEMLDRVCGPRGYRYAMMSAGRLGQRIYLAATSAQIGCCGIGAFYDVEAASLLGLSNQTKMLYLVGVGLVKKLSLGPLGS